MVEKITRDVLESHLACKYKCHLKLAGLGGGKSNYEAWLGEVRIRQKRETIVNLLAHYKECKIIHASALDVSTLKDGPDVILDGTFESNLLSLRFDGLIKVTGSSNLGSFHYVPVLFHEGRAGTNQRVLLEVFSFVLQTLQGRVPETGMIWGGKHKPATIRIASDLTTAKSIMTAIELVQSNASVPMLLLNDHCQVCEFKDICHAQALKEDNLSLLRGMKGFQIRQLNNKGIFTVNQLSYIFKPRRKARRAKSPAIIHHFPLQARAIRDKKCSSTEIQRYRARIPGFTLISRAQKKSALTILLELLQQLMGGSLTMPIGLTVITSKNNSRYSINC
jgi:predicted RecB family nuclease